jgi:type I site-specific restriction endonuclease
MPHVVVNESEWQTRKARIDPKLRASGWNVVGYRAGVPHAQFDRCAIEEYPTDNGPADYALCASGQILGVVEGKKVTLGPQNVLTQAERYSRGLTASSLRYTDGFHVPFLYSTNGEVVRRAVDHWMLVHRQQHRHGHAKRCARQWHGRTHQRVNRAAAAPSTSPADRWPRATTRSRATAPRPSSSTESVSTIVDKSGERFGGCGPDLLGR